MPQGKVAWAKKNHHKDDGQLHLDETGFVKAKVSEHNSDYFRFEMSAMNLLYVAPKDHIPPHNATTYSRHSHRSNELKLICEKLNTAPCNSVFTRQLIGYACKTTTKGL